MGLSPVGYRLDAYLCATDATTARVVGLIGRWTQQLRPLFHLYCGFSCWLTWMKVVRLGSSFKCFAPTYVHAERRPPRMSCSVRSTGPLNGTSTLLPSVAR